MVAVLSFSEKESKVFHACVTVYAVLLVSQYTVPPT